MQDDYGNGGGGPPADTLDVDTDSLEEFGDAAESESEEYGTHVAGNRVSAVLTAGEKTTLEPEDVTPTWGTAFEEAEYVRGLHDRQLELARSFATDTHGGLKAFAYGSRLIARDYDNADSYNAITLTAVDTAVPETVPQPSTGSATAAEERQRREEEGSSATGSATAAEERQRREDGETPGDTGSNPSSDGSSTAAERRQDDHATPDDLKDIKDEKSSSDREYGPGALTPDMTP